jgi:hypothetical protein
MKRYALLFLMLTIYLAAFAQSKVFITGNLGATVNIWNPAPFNQFVDSYNSYVTNNVKTAMAKFGKSAVGFSRGFGAIIDFGKSSVGFQYTKCAFNQKTTGTFNNGNGREIGLRFVNWNFNFDFSRKIGKRVDLGLLFGIAMRDGKVFSYATYGNGSNRSVGPEFWINGVYHGMLELDANLGLNVRVNFLKYFAFQLTAYRSFLFAAGDQPYLDAFGDPSPGKNPYSEYFPKDLELFEDNIQNQVYDFEENVIPNRFPGWYIQPSIIFKLNITEKGK